MKLHLGCGHKILEGYVNVDLYGNPDVIHDLEEFPYPWEDNSIDEILAEHVLEHIGQSTKVYFGIIKELYRICKKDAIIRVEVPHPRWDAYLIDPTHIRAITPESFMLFDQEYNQECIDNNSATSTLGIYLDVNFKVQNIDYDVDPKYLTQLQKGLIDEHKFWQYFNERNNVVNNVRFELLVIK